MNDDIWGCILRNTNVKTLGKLAQVSKHLQVVAEKDDLWLHFFQLKYPEVFRAKDRSIQRAWKIRYRSYKPSVYQEHGDAYNHIVCEHEPRPIDFNPSVPYPDNTRNHKCHPDSYWADILHQFVKSSTPPVAAHSVAKKMEFKVLVVGEKQVGKKSVCSRFASTNDLLKTNDSKSLADGVSRINCYVGDKAIGKNPLDINCRYVPLVTYATDSVGLINHKPSRIDAIICVFKITRFETFEALERLYADVYSQIPIRILVGTHLDYEPANHEVSYQAANAMADRNGMTYFELAANDTSAGGRMNIFVDIARSLKEKHDKQLESYMPKPEFGVSYGGYHHKQRIAPCSIQ